MLNLRGVDLNLLPVLRVLLREGSVTRAAAALGLSQPATSQALGRLRVILGDPLLVKVGRSMRLTPRAERLLELAEHSCAAIGAVFTQDHFNPALATRRFSVATPDYTALIFGEALLPRLRETAPGLSIHFADVGGAIRDQILSGAVDLALIARVPAVVEGLCVSAGFFDDQVCVVSPDHPLAARDKVSRAELQAHRCLGIDIAPRLVPGFDPGHCTEPVRIGPSHLLVLPLLAAATGSAAIVTRSLGRLAMRHAPLQLIELTDPEAPIDVCIAWSRVNEFDPAHRWLREAFLHVLERHFNAAARSAS